MLGRIAASSRDVQERLAGSIALLMPYVNTAFFGLAGASLHLVTPHFAKSRNFFGGVVLQRSSLCEQADERQGGKEKKGGLNMSSWGSFGEEGRTEELDGGSRGALPRGTCRDLYLNGNGRLKSTWRAEAP